MFISKTLKFYKRVDVREEILRIAKDKEIAIKFGEKGFGKRPEVLQYPDDILEFAKKGATSFHCSEENWYNPLSITTGMNKKQMNELRKGWDLVLDIDCKLLDYSKIAAFYTIKALKHYGIKSISCKFSGNKGFHIGVPFESFPERIGGQETKELFPEAPRKIAAYIKHLIKEPVSNAIMKVEKGDFEKIVRKSEKKAQDIIRTETNEFGDQVQKLNAEPFLDIDTILISSRHLFRMPYSFHEKSELISIPIKLDKVLSFKKEEAKPENVVIKETFLDRDAERNEASTLIMQAFDFEPKQEPLHKNMVFKKGKEYDELSEAIPESLFPPCIKIILQGLEDGKKRALFILINFLSSVGWSYEEIEKRLEEWNKQNPESLREVYLKGQLRYAKTRKKSVLPPNCDNQGYYVDMLVCKPDALCRNIKNPIQYAKIKAKNQPKEKKTSKKPKKDDKTTSKS